mmetsp:Transcript_36169/g.96789  ORF Transcript_36169/g.96789 Transcript_36169/m.96789 type:complete len:81 (+) Transcript_36169:2-244(+)
MYSPKLIPPPPPPPPLPAELSAAPISTPTPTEQGTATRVQKRATRSPVLTGLGAGRNPPRILRLEEQGVHPAVPQAPPAG